LILSNAAGGVNPNFKVADIMILTDHINMMPEHPLRGRNIDELGPRFVDMSEPYNRKMIAISKSIAKQENIDLKEGVYVALTGPTFETPAEYGMVRAIGGDAVGMSTVPEVIVAKHQGMDCFCLSIITDLGGPEISFAVSHEEVLEAANKAMPSVIKVVKGLIKITINIKNLGILRFFVNS
jgi:purine-nucleoside phosphorylase